MKGYHFSFLSCRVIFKFLYVWKKTQTIVGLNGINIKLSEPGGGGEGKHHAIGTIISVRKQFSPHLK